MTSLSSPPSFSPLKSPPIPSPSPSPSSSSLLSPLSSLPPLPPCPLHHLDVSLYCFHCDSSLCLACIAGPISKKSTEGPLHPADSVHPLLLSLQNIQKEVISLRNNSELSLNNLQAISQNLLPKAQTSIDSSLLPSSEPFLSIQKFFSQCKISLQQRENDVNEKLISLLKNRQSLLANQMSHVTKLISSLSNIRNECDATWSDEMTKWQNGQNIPKGLDQKVKQWKNTMEEILSPSNPQNQLISLSSPVSMSDSGISFLPRRNRLDRSLSSVCQLVQNDIQKMANAFIMKQISSANYSTTAFSSMAMTPSPSANQISPSFVSAISSSYPPSPSHPLHFPCTIYSPLSLQLHLSPSFSLPSALTDDDFQIKITKLNIFESDINSDNNPSGNPSASSSLPLPLPVVSDSVKSLLLSRFHQWESSLSSSSPSTSINYHLLPLSSSSYVLSFLPTKIGLYSLTISLLSNDNTPYDIHRSPLYLHVTDPITIDHSLLSNTHKLYVSLLSSSLLDNFQTILDYNSIYENVKPNWIGFEYVAESVWKGIIYAIVTVNVGEMIKKLDKEKEKEGEKKDIDDIQHSSSSSFPHSSESFFSTLLLLLRIVARLPSNQILIVQGGGLHLLTSLLTSFPLSSAIHKECLSCLGNVATQYDNQVKIVYCNVMDHVKVSIMSQKYKSEVVEQGMRVVRNVLKNEWLRYFYVVVEGDRGRQWREVIGHIVSLHNQHDGVNEWGNQILTALSTAPPHPLSAAANSHLSPFSPSHSMGLVGGKGAMAIDFAHLSMKLKGNNASTTPPATTTTTTTTTIADDPHSFLDYPHALPSFPSLVTALDPNDTLSSPSPSSSFSFILHNDIFLSHLHLIHHHFSTYDHHHLHHHHHHDGNDVAGVEEIVELLGMFLRAYEETEMMGKVGKYEGWRSVMIHQQGGGGGGGGEKEKTSSPSPLPPSFPLLSLSPSSSSAPSLSTLNNPTKENVAHPTPFTIHITAAEGVGDNNNNNNNSVGGSQSVSSFTFPPSTATSPSPSAPSSPTSPSSLLSFPTTLTSLPFRPEKLSPSLIGNLLSSFRYFTPSPSLTVLCLRLCPLLTTHSHPMEMINEGVVGYVKMALSANRDNEEILVHSLYCLYHLCISHQYNNMITTSTTTTTTTTNNNNNNSSTLDSHDRVSNVDVLKILSLDSSLWRLLYSSLHSHFHHHSISVHSPLIFSFSLQILLESTRHNFHSLTIPMTENLKFIVKSSLSPSLPFSMSHFDSPLIMLDLLYLGHYEDRFPLLIPHILPSLSHYKSNKYIIHSGLRYISHSVYSIFRMNYNRVESLLDLHDGLDVILSLLYEHYTMMEILYYSLTIVETVLLHYKFYVCGGGGNPNNNQNNNSTGEGGVISGATGGKTSVNIMKGRSLKERVGKIGEAVDRERERVGSGGIGSIAGNIHNNHHNHHHHHNGNKGNMTSHGYPISNSSSSSPSHSPSSSPSLSPSVSPHITPSSRIMPLSATSGLGLGPLSQISPNLQKISTLIHSIVAEL